jgi:hypothetical protein
MAKNTKLLEQKKSLRSPDFRYIPCDSINLAVSDNGIKLILGVEEVDGTSLELVGAHLTHKTAMLLKAALNQGLNHYQKETGTELEEPELGPEPAYDEKL